MHIDSLQPTTQFGGKSFVIKRSFNHITDIQK